MCGIVGAASTRNVVDLLIEGIKKLEYRGYDSAGIAFLKDGHLERLRSTGRVAQLEEVARKNQTAGAAPAFPTPAGRRTARRARRMRIRISPPRDGLEIGVVHNGIVENYEAIRARMKALGYAFSSETDTEVLAHHVHSLVAKGLTLFEAVKAASREWEGAYAAGFISSREPDTVVGARKGSPLLVGLGKGENFLASDASALISKTREVVYLLEGDVVEVQSRARADLRRRGQVRGPAAHDQPPVPGLGGAGAVRPLHAEGDLRAAGRARQHPRDGDERAVAAAQSVRRRCRSGLRRARSRCCCSPAARAITPVSSRATGWRRSPGCPRRSRSRASTATAIRWRRPGTLVVTISQSGETADTLAALKHAQRERAGRRAHDLQRSRIGVDARSRTCAS